MFNHSESLPFTDEDKQQIKGALLYGCDRQTAVHLIARSLDDLRLAVSHDVEFAAEVRRSEATCELRHMKNLYEAAGETKNWRVSVWWLERRAPERFARRDPGVVTTRDLESVVSALALTIAEDVHDPQDRARLRSRLKNVVDSLHGPVVSATATASSVAGNLHENPDDSAV